MSENRANVCENNQLSASCVGSTAQSQCISIHIWAASQRLIEVTILTLFSHFH